MMMMMMKPKTRSGCCCLSFLSWLDFDAPLPVPSVAFAAAATSLDLLVSLVSLPPCSFFDSLESFSSFFGVSALAFDLSGFSFSLPAFATFALASVGLLVLEV